MSSETTCAIPVEETVDSKPPAVADTTDFEQQHDVEETHYDMEYGDQKWSAEEEKMEESEPTPADFEQQNNVEETTYNIDKDDHNIWSVEEEEMEESELMSADIERPLSFEEQFMDEPLNVDEQPSRAVTVLKDPPPLDPMSSEVSLKLPPPASNAAAAATTTTFPPGQEASTAADEAAKAAAKAAKPAKKPGAVASVAPPAPPSGKEIAEANFNSAAADGHEKPKEDATAGEGNDSNSPGQKKKEINTNFQDVQKTGKWGSITNVEMYGVAAISVIILIVVVVVIAVILSQDNGPKEETVPPATPVPTPMVTPIPVEERFHVIMQEVRDNPVALSLATNGTLPNDPTYYEGLLDSGVDCSLMPHECAMAWALYEDDSPPPTDDITHRFAMASLFYSLGGADWKVNTSWMTNSSYCEWHGIKCNRRMTDIEELDLSENNLLGEIPMALALVDSIAVISLKENAISGSLPGDLIANLPKLFVLYLQSNKLVGTIPANLRENGALCESSFEFWQRGMTLWLMLPSASFSISVIALLFIHYNNFTGPFPQAYCTAGQYGDGPVFSEFSLDCEKNPCPEFCCVSNNCF
jgi:hypothetical protein